ncbi:MAG: acyltransferase [Deltaproteobacteria bacterium]|nr:acyltransferase [Deltaproteobacteria bacterium]
MAASSNSAARFEAVDGLRAISILWMVAFHSLWLLGYAMPPGEFSKLITSPWLRPLAKGHFGVDIFFVLSGFLIGNLLMKELKREGRIGLASFYRRRAFRILPAYLVLLLLAYPVPDMDGHSVWANLLLVNNFVPLYTQFVPWSWSLVVEEQFYLVFPLVLPLILQLWKKPLSRLYLYFSALAAGIMTQSLLLRTHAINALPPFHPYLGWDAFGLYFDTIYDKPYTHFAGILCGIVVAHLLNYHELQKWFSKNALTARLFLGLCPVLLLTAMLEPSEGRVAVQLYLATVRTVFSALVAYVLAYVVCIKPDSSALARALSARPWKAIADVSYGAYLFHPLAILILYSTALKPLAKTPSNLLLGLPVLIAMSLGIGFVSYRCVERPAQALGKRLT